MDPLYGGLRPQNRFSKKSQSGMPLITVITVVYNAAAQLEQTIVSILGQSYANIEYIVIDGGSTDGTLDVIRKYDDKIAYWLSEPDRGIYDAMNKGILLASGDWINFMNAEDSFYRADVVERVAAAAADDTADLIYGHCEMIYGPGSSFIWKAGRLESLWSGMVFRHQSLFTKSSICKRYTFDLGFKVGADFAFIYTCYRNHLTFRKLDIIISTARLGGISDIQLLTGIRDMYRAVVRHQDELKVTLHYGWLIALTYVKMKLKRIMPGTVLQYIRQLKYR
jgi:glycosyltransferase involved in cell wall biosynthesis